MKILHVVGARPNFPKLAPVHRAGVVAGLQQIIVHTGQHYDAAMSVGFFRDLEIPEPDINLDVGSASHAAQTARIMERLEPVLMQHSPDWVVVYGDVNSTLAAAVVASKLEMPVAHVEAGLRSGDRSMPEEINRLVTDRLASLLLTPSLDAGDNLRREGEPEEEIVFVGNVMIDTLLRILPQARTRDMAARLGIGAPPVVVTLHRPSNVDDPGRLRGIGAALRAISSAHPVVFPVHPRTRNRMQELAVDLGSTMVLDPLDYLDMLSLVDRAAVVITDSGGLQEETTALGVPCLTVRENTERPVTITEGTNRLVADPGALEDAVTSSRRGNGHRRPAGWDGSAAMRVIEALRGQQTAAGSTG